MVRTSLQGDGGGGLVSARTSSSSRRGPVGIVVGLLGASLLSGCIVDGLASRLLEDEPPGLPPPAAAALLEGRVDAELAGGTAWLHQPLPATALLADSSRLGAGGDFQFSLPGTETFENLVLYAQKGQRVQLLLVPPLRRLKSVHDEGRMVAEDDLRAFSGPANELTTARLLVLSEAVWANPSVGFASVPPSLLSATLLELGQGSSESRTQALKKWEEKFTQLHLKAALEGDGPPLVDPASLRLNPDFLAQDGVVGLRDDARAALTEAATELRFRQCFDPDWVRTVFVVDMREGVRDGACRPIDRFRYAEDLGGKSMFLAGGVHPNTVGLEDPTAVSARLGSWEPNALRMFDDGTHGDLQAGDNLWSLAVDLPRLDPPLRIGYKYTWGLQGAGWGGTEEWPGNSRLLELVDNDGDGLVVRLDRFGDEAANKDGVNTHPAAMRQVCIASTGAGCGARDFDGDGIPATQEIPADLDGDASCQPDGWPRAGVGPLLGDPERQGGCWVE